MRCNSAGSVKLELTILFLTLGSFLLFPAAYAQSSQVQIEWALFNQILLIGIVVGLVVFGLLFYAIVRYREKPAVRSGK